MASRPILRKMLADIEKMGGFEKICERISEGSSIAEISRELGVSRNFLSGTLNRDPSQKEALRIARQQKADHYAEECLKLADTCEENANAISKMREQVNVRKWLASAYNPDSYAQRQNSVTISVGEMHLQALKKIRNENEDPEIIDS